MALLHLEWAKKLREAGKKLGREGLSDRAIELVKNYMKNDGSLKGAMILAGRLKAIGQAAKFDAYWTEQIDKGFQAELWDLPRLGEVYTKKKKLVVRSSIISILLLLIPAGALVTMLF